jgi:hypothetical protein
MSPITDTATPVFAPLAGMQTIRERQALDAELLARLRAHGRPATLPEIFGGLSPRWATEAAERLTVAGRVRELADGRLAVVAAPAAPRPTG